MAKPRSRGRALAAIIALQLSLTTGPVTTHAYDSESVEIERLIEALVSSNPKPQRSESGRGLIYPEGYDEKGEEAVFDAAVPLLKKGPAAFPTLMKHSEDRRFSFCRESAGSGAMRAWHVGKACELIIESQLDVYDKVGFDQQMFPNYFDNVVKGKKFDAWWKAHREETLADLQIEAFEWAIQQETNLLEEWNNKASGKRKVAGLKEIIGKNERRLKELKKSREPIDAKNPLFKYYP
jgi:hypothetical protein